VVVQQHLGHAADLFEGRQLGLRHLPIVTLPPLPPATA
jgi:hypothetical protein